MRVSISKNNERILMRGAAILLLGGLTAGCSSGTMRFADATDGIYTGSTANQRQIINNQQPYPADNTSASMASNEAVERVPANAPVSRSSLPPVGSSAPTYTAAAAPVEPAHTLKPVGTKTASLEAPRAPLDSTTTGAVAADEETIKGWSKAGGTQITAKDGESVYNLSKRFGVPADVLMKMNGLTAERGLQVGQKVVIPTYVYSSKAGVSAPDNNPRVAEAKSSKGIKEPEAPKPTEAPSDKMAVLPNGAKSRDGKKTEALSADASAQPKKGTYTVAEGDSLTRIAKKTGVGVAAIKEANGIKDGNIRIGQTLKIPAAGEASAKVAAVDTTKTGSIPATEKAPSAKQVTEYTPPKKEDKAIEQAEQDDGASAPNATGIGKMRWPVTGRVVSSYAKGRNDGMDISVPKGTPVKAAENGVVIYAGNGLKDFGNTVLVRHENGLVTVYGHASELKVQRGQKVKRGEEIAVSGMSGNADAPKLHFEVRKNSSPVDPKTFLD